ncbi:MAG: AAA family ATPase [Planctomycetota bacterium]
MRELLEWRPDQPADACGWYRRDENAIATSTADDARVDAVYVLRPRTGRFEDAAVWRTEVEVPLLEAIVDATESMYRDTSRRPLYGASATEHEINSGALAVADAVPHAMAFYRRMTTGDGRPLRATDLRGFVDVDDDGRLDESAQRRLRLLKARLRRRLGRDNVRHYDARCEDGKLVDDLSGFATAVEAQLARVVQAQIDASRKRADGDHARFADDRASRILRRVFVGRERELQTIADYLASSKQSGALAVLGPQGIGKSALMAVAAQHARDRHGGAFVVERHVASNPELAEVGAFLADLNREIGERYGQDDAVDGGDIHEAADSFADRLAAATPEQPLFLFLDAVDLLDVPDKDSPLHWLPEALPAGVRLVISAQSPAASAPTSQQQTAGTVLATASQVADRVVLDGIDASDAEVALRAILDAEEASFAGSFRMRRTVAPRQLEVLRDRFGERVSPHYSRMIALAAREWRSWENPSNLARSAAEFIRDDLRGLSKVAHHSPVLVRRACAFVLASRFGLTEQELTDLLAADDEFWNDLVADSAHELKGIRAVPASVFLRFCHDIDRFLVPGRAFGGTTLRFAGAAVESVARLLFGSGDDRAAFHSAVARYFCNRPVMTGDSADLRNLTERLHALSLTYDMHDQAEAALLDSEFITAYCTHLHVSYRHTQRVDHLGVMHLANDLQTFAGRNNLPASTRELAADLRRALLAVQLETRMYPELVAQHLANSASASPRIRNSAALHLSRRGVWFRAITPQRTPTSPSRATGRVVLDSAASYDLVSCSPAQRQFVCRSEGPAIGRESLDVWDVDERRKVWTITEHASKSAADTPLAVRWLGDRGLIMTVRKNGDIVAAHIDGRRIAKLATVGADLEAAHIGRDGLVVVAIRMKDVVRFSVVDLVEEDIKDVGDATAQGVVSMASAPDGSAVFAVLGRSEYDGQKSVWRLPIDGSSPSVFFKMEWPSSVSAVAVARSRRYVAIGTSQGGVFVVNADTGFIEACQPGWAERQFRNLTEQHSRRLMVVDGKLADDVTGDTYLRECVTSLVFDDVGQRVIAASSAPDQRLATGGTIALDLGTGVVRRLRDSPDGIRSLDLLAGRNELVAGGMAELFVLNANDNGAMGAELPDGVGLDGGALSPDGRRVALSYTGVLYIVDAETRAVARTVRPGAGFLREPRWHGDLLSAIGADELIHVWQPMTGQRVAVYDPHDDTGAAGSIVRHALLSSGPIACVAAMSDRIVLFGRDGTKAVHRVDARVDDFAVSPSGATCIVALDRVACFAVAIPRWDVLGGIEVESATTRLTLLDDATAITAHGPIAGSIVAWDTGSGDELGRFATAKSRRLLFRGTTSSCQQLIAWRCDDPTFCSVHANGCLHLWRIGSTDPLATLPMDEAVKDVAFANDGESVHVLCDDGSVRTYRVELAAHADRRTS